MFRSRRRSVVFPQDEHARFAGTIATFWGNHDVPGPPLPRDAFALGVATHDRGYGSVDAMGIGEVDEGTWLATQRRGVHRRSRDPVVDTVVLLHLRRLLSRRDSEAVRELASLIEIRIDENLEGRPEDLAAFRRADSITAICDLISFHFCFEERKSFVHRIESENGEITIAVEASGDGRVGLEPWPLSVPALYGFILGYAAEGYPERLDPVLVPYAVESSRSHASAASSGRGAGAGI